VEKVGTFHFLQSRRLAGNLAAAFSLDSCGGEPAFRGGNFSLSSIGGSACRGGTFPSGDFNSIEEFS
jgi:hypothetical protein